MSELTPVQKIDIVLDYFKSNTNKIPYDTLVEEMKSKGVITLQAHLRTIIDKLKYDRLVIDDTLRGQESEQLLITYEGLLFKGYQATILDEENALAASVDERAHFHQIEQQGIDNGRDLSILTGKLVTATNFAAWAAVALLVWQVVQFLLEHCAFSKM